MKTRLWDTEKKVMITGPVYGDLDFCIDLEGKIWVKEEYQGEYIYAHYYEAPEGRFIKMMSTGFLDRNSKEIYVGDIIRILYTDWPSQHDYTISLDEYLTKISKVGQAQFSGDRFSIDFGEYRGTGSMFHGTHGRKEVIGNIYETPELLPDAK